MRTESLEEKTRGGYVKSVKEPVLITHTSPRERVIFCEERKENPVFHFMECLWMMAGRRDSKWLEQFNPRMAEFADDGEIHGAYGHRWRYAFGFNQIGVVIKMLRKDPTTRRAVIQMWDALDDLNSPMKDLPCNTHIYFRVFGKHLDMTVCNRSNDLVWGALGSNVVHFSFLQEIIAHEVGLGVGDMHQFTNNLHIYERHWDFLDIPPHFDQYNELKVTPFSIIQAGSLPNWLRECSAFIDGERGGFSEPIFKDVAVPMIEEEYNFIKATDWRLSCQRYAKRKSKAKAG
jgi:hypothetical protein